MVVYTGANFNASVGIESSFLAGSGTAYGNLGLGMKISAFSLRQDMEPMYSLGSRTPNGFYSKGHTVDISTEFYLCGDNKNWRNFVLDSNGSSGGSISSAFVNILSGDNTLYNIKGVVFKSAKIDIRQNEVVLVSMDGVGAKVSETANSTLSSSIPSTVYTWKDVSVSIGGSAVSQPITEIGITIDNSLRTFFGLGSETIKEYAPMEFKGTIDFQILNPSGEIAFDETLESISITIGNYTFDISGAVRQETGMNSIEAVNEVVDKLSYQFESITVS